MFVFLIGLEKEDLSPTNETNAPIPEVKQGKFFKIGTGPSLFPRGFRDNFLVLM